MKQYKQEMIQLAKQLKAKGGVGPKFVKLSGEKNDTLYKGLIRSHQILNEVDIWNI